MTMHPGPDGRVSFRVIIGVGGERTAKHDLLELIIGAEHIGDLSRVLADPGTGITGDSDPMPPFPCHIGFCRNAISTANLTGQLSC
jgi:hypothetical protein